MKAQRSMADLLREVRQRLDLTQEKFAARLGVTTPTINRWENGRARPSPLALRQLATLLRRMGRKGSDLLALINKHEHEATGGARP